MKPGPEYYRSRRWRIIRGRIIKRDKSTCRRCSVPVGGALCHVHHITYANIGTPKEKDDCLTLCIVCHGNEHNVDFLKDLCDNRTSGEYLNGKLIVDEKRSKELYDCIKREKKFVE